MLEVLFTRLTLWDYIKPSITRMAPSNIILLIKNRISFICFSGAAFQKVCIIIVVKNKKIARMINAGPIITGHHPNPHPIIITPENISMRPVKLTASPGIGTFFILLYSIIFSIFVKWFIPLINKSPPKIIPPIMIAICIYRFFWTSLSTAIYSSRYQRQNVIIIW